MEDRIQQLQEEIQVITMLGNSINETISEIGYAMESSTTEQLTRALLTLQHESDTRGKEILQLGLI